jgi:major outer membrane protein
MKQIAAVLTFFVLSAIGYALPIGNPWEASLMRDGLFREGCCTSFCDPSTWCNAWSFRIGFYGDYVYNHRMEIDRSHQRDNIHETEIWTNSGYLAFNMFDRFDLFATLGTTQLEINTPRKSFGGTGINDYVAIQSDTGFSWSIGIRAALWEFGSLGIGAEAQYFSACSDINFVKEENADPDYRDGDNLKFQEWQLGFGAAYRINIASCTTALVPYIGIKWGRGWIDLGKIQSGELTIYDLRSERSIGYACGITLLGSNKASVTAEARYVDEKALYVNGQFRF